MSTAAPPAAGPPAESLGVAHPTLAALRAAKAAVDRWNAGPVWSYSDDDLLGAVDEAQRLAAAVEWGRLRQVREADGRDLAGRTAGVSTSAWLRNRWNLRSGESHRSVKLAAALDGPFSSTGEALAAGTVCRDQAEAIVRAVENLPGTVPADVPARAELFLLGWAESLDADALARLGRALRQTYLEPPDDDHDPATGRELWLTDTAEGTVRLRGVLDAEAGGLLRSALDPLARPQPGPDGTPDARSAARRRADALADLVNRAATAGTLPSSGGVRPHVTVVVDLPTLLGEKGAPPAEDGWGQPLSQATLQRICCDANITRVVTGPGGVPLDLGRAYRVVPPPLRRAVTVRDRCCAFPGCDRPAGWCEVHHVAEWTRDGGETKLDNLVLLCGQHHRTIHHTAWEVRIAPDGLPEFLPPTWVDPQRTPRRNPHRRRLAALLRDGLTDDPRLSDRAPRSHLCTRGRAATRAATTRSGWLGTGRPVR